MPGIVFNETEADLIYARTDIGGLYRWQEPTQTWKPLLDWVGWDNWGWTGVVSVATDPVEPNRVYAAVGTYTNDWDPNNGAVLYSDDYGETWGVAELPFKQGGNMPGRGMGERLAVDPADNAELYLGTPNGNGLWRSKDYGRTWAEVEELPEPRELRRRTPTATHSGDNQGVIWIEFDQTGGRIYRRRRRPGRPALRLRGRRRDLAARPRRRRSIGAVDGNTHHPQAGRDRPPNGHLYIVTSWDPGPYNGGPASGKGGAIWRLDLADRRVDRRHPDLQPASAPSPASAGSPSTASTPARSWPRRSNNWWPDEIIYRSTDSGADLADELGLRVGRGLHGPPDRNDRFTMDHSGSEWLTWGAVDDGPAYAVKHGWMIDALAIDPHDSDRIMWGTGATIWGTEELTAWDAQGELVGWDDAAGHQVAAAGRDQFTVRGPGRRRGGDRGAGHRGARRDAGARRRATSAASSRPTSAGPASRSASRTGLRAGPWTSRP